MVVQASLLLDHRGCVSQRLHGGTVLTQISGERGYDVFVLQAPDPQALEAAVRDCERHVGREITEFLGRSPTCVVFRGINTPGGTIGIIRATGCVILWPVVYREGKERYNILAPTREELARLVRDLGAVATVAVERVAEVLPQGLDVSIPLGDLTGQLTRRQLEALTLAMRHGYYDVPRGTSTAVLARGMGIGRTTFEEHLRKAEQRVLGQFAELLGDHAALQQGPLRGRGRPLGAAKGGRARPSRRAA